MRMPGRASTIVLALVLFAAAGAACGDDDEGAESNSTTEAAETEVVEVTAIDYGYEGLPGSIEPGTRLTLTNSSTKEIHELVAFLLPEDEERSAEEISKLSEAELGALFAGEPATVLIAKPDGGDMIPALGDGTISEEGRYVVFCAIPVGADPQDYLDAVEKSQGGPPEVAGGAPHFTQGMYGEVSVG